MPQATITVQQKAVYSRKQPSGQKQFTKKELLVQAKILKIKGRHDMTVEQLRTEVQKRASQAKTKVVRKGKNLSGNKPYHGIVYSVTKPVPAEQLKQEPQQVQLIVRFMEKTGIKARGGDIVAAAVKAGALKTRMKDPRVLFGYYAKRINQLQGVNRLYEEEAA